ncbi:hypothetical protein Q8A73_020060 [Channa argus]|nr:hypothetical protein Q8A73_020060 [Channa argus]
MLPISRCKGKQRHSSLGSTDTLPDPVSGPTIASTSKGPAQVDAAGGLDGPVQVNTLSVPVPVPVLAIAGPALEPVGDMPVQQPASGSVDPLLVVEVIIVTLQVLLSQSSSTVADAVLLSGPWREGLLLLGSCT